MPTPGLGLPKAPPASSLASLATWPCGLSTLHIALGAALQVAFLVSSGSSCLPWGSPGSWVQQQVCGQPLSDTRPSPPQEPEEGWSQAPRQLCILERHPREALSCIHPLVCSLHLC